MLNTGGETNIAVGVSTARREAARRVVGEHPWRGNVQFSIAKLDFCCHFNAGAPEEQAQNFVVRNIRQKAAQSGVWDIV